MVATSQNLRHGHPPECGRTGVVGVLEQRHGMALLLKTARAANGAGQESHHSVDHHHRCQLPSGEDEITDRHLFIGQAPNPLIKPFVVATDQNQLLRAHRPSAQVLLAQGNSLGAHQQHPSG